MQIPTLRLAEVVLARPAGRIDHTSAAAFEAALAPLVDEAAASGGTLVLDFAGIDYISSVGLRALMVASRQMRGRRAPFVVARLQKVVAEIFAISRFDKVLTLAPTLEDAVAGCSPAARQQLATAGGTQP